MTLPLYDITQRLRPGMPSWPGDTPFASRQTATVGVDCPVNVFAWDGSTHLGTHADAPLHYDPAGAAIDALLLDPFLGPARLLDLRGCGPLVGPDAVRDRLGSDPVPRRLLLRLLDRFPHDGWHDGFPALDPALLDWFGAAGGRLIGLDSPSIDPFTAKVLAAHDAARRADLRILEGLVLDHVPPGEYELIALPLPLAGLDASPVRAVLRPLSAPV